MATIGGVRPRDDDPAAQYERFASEGPKLGPTARKLEMPEDVRFYELGSDAVLFAKQGFDGTEASVNDLHQRALGDCYFQAAAGALTSSDAGQKVLQEAIRENKDPSGKTVSYTVRFFEKRDGAMKPVEVVVPASKLVEMKVVETKDNVSTTSWRLPSSPRPTDDRKQTEVWTAVLEMAFILHSGGAAKVGHGGRPADAMTMLTGKPAEHRGMLVEGDPRADAIGCTPRALKAELAAGKLLVANTRDADGVKTVHLVRNHSYTVTGVTLHASGEWSVSLHNPHGTESEEKVVPYAVWRRYLEGFDVGSP